MAKRALLVGINYKGTSSQLQGCINDVQNVKRMLLTKGFTEDNITLLTDDTQVKPIKQNIMNELNKLCSSSSVPSVTDVLYFHYSGHGTQVPDRNGDEEDGKDEAICPLDYRVNGFITDDEIRICLNKVPVNTKMFCVFDSCHSGTVCDLAYNIAEIRGKLSFCKDNKHPDSPANIMCVSACNPTQTAADSSFNGQAQGALTYAFIFSVTHGGATQFNELFRQINKMLKMGRYSQCAHFSSGRFIPVVTKLYF